MAVTREIMAEKMLFIVWIVMTGEIPHLRQKSIKTGKISQKMVQGNPRARGTPSSESQRGAGGHEQEKISIIQIFDMTSSTKQNCFVCAKIERNFIIFSRNYHFRFEFETLFFKSTAEPFQRTVHFAIQSERTPHHQIGAKSFFLSPVSRGR